ncbi:MAG: GDSL-type esterase/lipase family protein [Pseudomonadota bacterium]
MLPWKTTKAICLALLVLPLVHLAVLLSHDFVVMLDRSPEAWQDELEAYAEQDAERPLPANPVLVTGGGPAWLWQGLSPQIAPMPVLMRGLSGATLDDLQHHYRRIVGYYQPRTLVVMPGISEFHFRDDKSVAEFIESTKQLEALDEIHRGEQRFYLVAPFKTLLFPGDDQRIDNINAQLKAWATTDQRVTILDVNPVLAGGPGRPDPFYFRPDGFNLNTEGYARLAQLLRAQLAHDYPGELPLAGS